MTKFFDRGVLTHLITDTQRFNRVEFDKIELRRVPMSYMEKLYAEDLKPDYQIWTMLMIRLDDFHTEIERELTVLQGLLPENDLASGLEHLSKMYGYRKQPHESADFIIQNSKLLPVFLDEVVEAYDRQQVLISPYGYGLENIRSRINRLEEDYWKNSGTSEEDWPYSRKLPRPGSGIVFSKYISKPLYEGLGTNFRTVYNNALELTAHALVDAPMIGCPATGKTFTEGHWFNATRMYYKFAKQADLLVKD